MKLNLIVLAGVALGITLGSAAMADPNLVPQFNANTGTVKVTNTGADPTLIATFATVECTALNGGMCPDPAPAMVAPYVNPAFPNKATVLIIPLNPGAQHNHVLAFYAGLVFAPGKYVFTVCADAGADVVEKSERDNCIRVTKTVRGKLTGPGGLTSNTATN
jgi:hypothetical protein